MDGEIMDMNMIKKLREETKAGMMECKKALEEAHGNYEEALKNLTSMLSKHEGNKRVASKGLCYIESKDNQAIVFEINAETDFAAKNETFKKLLQLLGKNLIDTKASYPKEALKQIIDTRTVEDLINQASGIMKENLILRRFYRIIKKDEQSFGSYVHQDGKIISLVILNGKNDEIARDLSMQIAANQPVYLSLSSIDEQTLNYEKFMYEKEHQIFDQKLFDEHIKNITLYEQSFIKKPDIKIKDLLSKNKLEMIDFFRFEIGQGIEDKLNCKLDIPCDGSKITVTPIYS